MYYKNCHKINHNVETIRVKRKEDPIPSVSKVATQQIEVYKTMRFHVIFMVILDIRS
jgi:hypothetical protein